MPSRAVADRISLLCERNGGRLTAAMVVRDARNRSSPLHGEFDWNVNRAAMRHWLDQARRLIRSIQVEIRHQRVELKVPLYLRDVTCGAGEQGYATVHAIRTDEERAQGTLRYELSRAIANLERCLSVSDALGLGDEIREVLNRVRLVSEKVAVRFATADMPE